MDTERNQFGIERMLDVVRAERQGRASAIVHKLYETAREFSGGRPQGDDMTAVVIKVL
jgi:serine phosphatase RsbU (regulator of sigma subunit)